MAKRDHYLRYISIISRIRNQRDATFEEIMDYLEMQSEIRDFKPEISKRTFQRDLEEIASLFNIEIRYDFSRKLYYIRETEENSDLSNRLLEAFDTMSLCNAAEGISPYVIFENRRPQGTHHFNGLLHAIKNHLIVHFDYLKFWGEDFQRRSVEPLALKESRDRWYLIGRDQKDHKVKTFGLDRISELQIAKRTFKPDKTLDIGEKFRHCFGVLGDEKNPPQEIVLTIDALQGKYIKSFPLHNSQKIISDDQNGLKISLYMYITRDLIMELLSLGETMQVVKPTRLRKELCKSYRASLLLNCQKNS